MLGIDVKVEDDGHKKVQQAEKEHSLADALQRPPKQSAHPAGGRWPAQWARASGCWPEHRGRETDFVGQSRMGKLTTYLLPSCSFTDPHPYTLAYSQPLTLTDSHSICKQTVSRWQLSAHLSAGTLRTEVSALCSLSSHRYTGTHSGTHPYCTTLHTYTPRNTRHVNSDHTDSYLSMETHLPRNPHVHLCPREQTPHWAASSTQGSWLREREHLLSTYHAGILYTHDFI